VGLSRVPIRSPKRTNRLPGYFPVVLRDACSPGGTDLFLTKPMKQTLTLLLTLPVIWLVVRSSFCSSSGSRRSHSADAGEGATPADIGALRHQYGLDLPLHTSTSAIGPACCTAIWETPSAFRSVTHLIAERYPIPRAHPRGPDPGARAGHSGGIFAALHRAVHDQTPVRGSAFSAFSSGIALGPHLILIFSIRPSACFLSLGHNAGQGCRRQLEHWTGRYLILPAFTMGRVACRDPHPAWCARDARRARQDYIRTARAKGLSESAVVWRTRCRTHLFPSSRRGTQFGALLAGAIVTEKIFSWPASAGSSSTPSSNRTTRWCRAACSRSD